MPLSLGTSRLITSRSRRPAATAAQNNIVNVNNITQTSSNLALSEGDHEILIDTPADQYFNSSTWTLNLILPERDRYCATILIGLTQDTRQWPVGTTCTINFLSKQKIVATTLIGAQPAFFYKFIIATGGSKISIHKHDLEPLTMVA